jgi:hypothetical protein
MVNSVSSAAAQGIATVAGAATQAAIVSHASTCGACGVMGAATATGTQAALTAVMLAHPVTATFVIGSAVVGGVFWLFNET